MKPEATLPSARPAPLVRALEKFGRGSALVLDHAGALGTLAWQVAVSAVKLRFPRRELFRQFYIMGIESLPIVFVTGALAGIVTSQQGGYQMTGAIPLYVLGSLVVQTVVLEMGPVLTAIVLVGRVGASVLGERAVSVGVSLQL